MQDKQEQEGFLWQVGVWDRISTIYLQDIDRRFVSVVENVIARADLRPGERILDLGTGTGAVAEKVAPLVRPGEVLGVDISPQMLTVAQRRLLASGVNNVTLREGRAEEIPVGDHSVDVVLASLSLMYVVDRAAAAREIARVLKHGGRLVAAIWAGAEQCDIVLFQQTAGRYAPDPPVPGVGPGALADPSPFIEQLARAGVTARVETETLGFDFESFDSAWDVLAGVTTAGLSPERLQEAKAAVKQAMYPSGEGPRHFRNVTQFIVGER